MDKWIRELKNTNPKLLERLQWRLDNGNFEDGEVEFHALVVLHVTYPQLADVPGYWT